MIKIYFDLDMKLPGIYGYRTILDYDSTCYAKVCILILIFIFLIDLSMFFEFHLVYIVSFS